MLQMENKKVFYGILAIIAILGIGLFVFDRFVIKDKRASEDFYSCARDSDCISVKADCCGCGAGGQATAINKNLEKQWKDKLAEECKDINCIEMISNDHSCFKEPKCVNDKCVLEDLKKDITVLTDKTEYEQGETVTFRIDGKVMVTKQGGEELSPYSIKDSAGNRPQLRHSCTGVVGVGIDQYCENGKIKTVEVVHCSDVFQSWEEEIHKTYTWDQKAYFRIEEECEGKTIHREILKQVSVGKYKIFVYDDKGNEKIISEFTIKEKSAVDPRCSQKVEFNPNCAIARIVYGYEFDSIAGKCKEVNAGGGCDFETPFNSLDECQKICEKNTIASNNCIIEIPAEIMLQSLWRYNIVDNNSGFKSMVVSDNLCFNSYASSESGYYLVQYDGPITEDEQKQVESLGCKLYGYVPQNSFIYKMDETVKNKVEALKFIKWVGVYQPAFRIAPSISDEIIKSDSKQRLNVLIFDANYNDIVSKIEKLGGIAEYKKEDFVGVAINASKIPDIARINDVVWIELYTMPSIF